VKIEDTTLEGGSQVLEIIQKFPDPDFRLQVVGEAFNCKEDEAKAIRPYLDFMD
jgi:hypothetical protein